MFALGNATFACVVRSARERSFEEAGGMGGSRILYVGGKVGAKPRAWGAKKIDTIEH